MTLAALLLPLGLPLAAQAADCPEPMPPASLEAELEAAERAFRELEAERFAEALQAVTTTLPCLSAPIPSSLAARTHRIYGLERFLAQDGDAAATSGAASRALEPDFRFDDAFLPPGHPYRLAVEGFDPASGGWRELPPPEQGSLYLDGRESLQRPTAWATIFQQVGPEGEVLHTRYLQPDEATPSYPGAQPAVVQRPTPLPAETRPRPGAQPPLEPVATGPSAATPLLVTAGSMAVLSGLSYGLAAAQAARFDSPDMPLTREQVFASQPRTNALVAGSATLATGALILGGVAVFAF